MSDITSLNNMAGANPALAKPAPGARTAPEPPTVQNAVAQPLNTAQSAVTQSPTSGQAEWKRKTDPDGQHSPASGAVSTQQQMDQTVNQLNQRMSEYHTNLQFEMDRTYQQVVVRIVDRETKEVVRQIPSETALALAKFFDDLAATRSHSRSSYSSDSNDSQPLNAEGLLLQVTA